MNVGEFGGGGVGGSVGVDVAVGGDEFDVGDGNRVGAGGVGGVEARASDGYGVVDGVVHSASGAVVLAGDD